jgi:hypothetical protein
MKTPDYIESSVWYREVINDPYQTIAGFFDYAPLPSHREHLSLMFRAACSFKIWKYSSAAEFMYFMERLESVVNAAYLIHKLKKKSPLMIEKNNAFDPNLYSTSHAFYTDWDYFPRMLSFPEFADPYKVINHFFKSYSLQEWKEILKEFAYYALSNSNLQELSDFPCIFILYELLTKLTEALHLIDVREVNHVGGFIKNRRPGR